ncbi:MAG: protein kinase [Acidobacteriota bacterium]
MIGQTVGHYRILERLGQGGMGVVYKALDTKLNRHVAIKVLPPELTVDAERRLRFQREAQTAAALDHPNIATIHEVGEHEGSQYIVMQLVEGRTLREVIGHRPMPLKEWLRLAVPIAEGLAHAHARHVIHRDLKPDNVMITPEHQVKILDFGLAKLLEPEAAPSGQASDAQSRMETISRELTRAGKVFGTVAYMSPEQARGERADHRSDLFSFGIVLYQMATGRLPFKGKSDLETLHAIVAEEPTPVSQVSGEHPPEVERVVRKAMEKDPGDRYQHADDMAVDLRRLQRDSDSGVRTIPKIRRTSRRWVAALAAAVTLLAGALVAYRYFTPGLPSPSPDSLAVMYFENLADPADGDSLGRMLTSLLTTELSGTEGLQVMSSQRLYDIAKQIGAAEGPVDRSVASEVARRAKVGTMVLGQVAQAGNRIVATTELVDVASGRSLSSQKAEGQHAQDIFAMAEALGEQVRRDVRRPSRAGDRRGRLGQQLTNSLEAYRAYTRGEVLIQRFDFSGAAEQFQEAVQLDPDFPLPYYRLTYLGLWSYLDEAVAQEAAERAVVLAEKLPEAHQQIVKATALTFHGRLSEAIPLYESALKKDPQNKEGLYMLGENYSHSVRDYDPDKAVEVLAQAVALDPDFTVPYYCLVIGRHYQGKREEAMSTLDRLEIKEPGMAQEIRALLAALQGRSEEAFRLCPASATEVTSLMRSAYAMLSSEWGLARELVSRDPGQGSLRAWAYRNRGDFHAYRGEFDRALDAYRKGGSATSFEPHEGFKGGATASALYSLAELLAVRGDLTAARAEAERALVIQPDSPMHRYYAGLFALRDQDVSSAKQQLEAIAMSLETGRVTWGDVYRDALEAEIALAEERPQQARALFEKIVNPDKLLFDYSLSMTSAGAVIREGLVRTYLALGETEEAAKALEDLLSCGMERVNHPVVYTQALYTLGLLKTESNDQAGGRQLLEKFLDHWGNADWDLPQVADARKRLAALGEI